MSRPEDVSNRYEHSAKKRKLSTISSSPENSTSTNHNQVYLQQDDYQCQNDNSTSEAAIETCDQGMTDNFDSLASPSTAPSSTGQSENALLTMAKWGFEEEVSHQEVCFGMVSFGTP